MIAHKYELIYDDLKKQIESEQFENGDLFYSEAELKKIYGVSSITVIRALKELENDGYIVRYQGRGTFVSRSRKQKLVKFTDVEDYSGDNGREVVEILGFNKQHDPKILKQLKLSKKDAYYEIIRLRRINGKPFFVHYSYIPARYIREDIDDPNYYRSIYQRLREDFDLHLYDLPFEERDEIEFPAPAHIQKLLSLQEPVPVVKQVKTTTTIENQPIEYVIGYKKYDFFHIKLTAPDYNN